VEIVLELFVLFV
jgi:hypothetical protein